MLLSPSDLKKYNYFTSLSEDALAALAQKLTTVRYARGEVVLKEGEPGDFFYFVKQGRLAVTKKTANGQEAKLSVIGSGNGFGEMALLTCGSRSCTVQTLTQTTLYRLAKKDFEEIVLHASAFTNMLRKKFDDFAHYNRIKTLQPFALLDPDKMYAVLSRMIEKTYDAGEDIIVQNEKGDFYYIVKEGRVAVLRKDMGGATARQVAVLAEGDGFGEEALIRDDPRNATCRALERTTVYALDREDFDQIMKTSFLESVYSEDIDLATYREKFVIIDARIAPEYEEQRIEGAMNVPLEMLRDKYPDLDPAKEYITYCTNDARGMVAAFLLKNHGFKARCLRGGISSWTGPIAADHDGVHLPA